VFDAAHAFVCDGVIVHNSGADIIKIAMGGIYKECKKRGWLDQVRMIATMHDELVFEVHGSLLEEAIAVITPIMTSNAMIVGRNWPIPLTTDCEIGSDWTVNWALNEMLFNEIRFDGNKKVKEPKKPQRESFPDDDAAYQKALAAYPAKKAAWAAMPHSWPEELRLLFKNPGSVEGGSTENPSSSSPLAPTPAPLPPSAEVPFREVRGSESSSSTLLPPPQALKAGETYDFVLNAPMTPGNCVALAEVIASCQAGGTKKLRLLLPDGTILTGWSDTEFHINPDQFYWAARGRGLVG